MSQTLSTGVSSVKKPGRYVLWYGQLTTNRRLFRRGWSMLGVPATWLILFLLLPALVLAALAFCRRTELGEVNWTFTLDNFKRLAGWGTFGWSSNYIWIVARSVWIAVVTTVIAILLAYPLSFLIATRQSRMRYFMLGLVMVPFCTNMVIRTYAWSLIFSNQLPFAKLAAWMGLIDEGMSLYPSPFAVYVGMVSSFLPFAVLPIYTNVERMDWSIVEAAQDLYAGKWRTFRHAVLPQTIPGLVAAIILTFIPAMGTFVISDMLGGANYMLVGNLIQQQFGGSRDLPFGSSISFVLMILTMISVFLLRKHEKKVEQV